MNPVELFSGVAGFVTGALWLIALAALAAGLFLTYTTEVLARKLGAPPWMAWVPVVNVYLLFALAGGSPGAFLGVLFGSILILGSAGLLAMAIGEWFYVSVAGVWGLGVLIGVVWMHVRIAERRRLHPLLGAVVGLAPVLALGLASPLLAPLAMAPLGAWLYIVFHDGLPRRGPHPLAYAVIALSAAAVIGPLWYFTDSVAHFNAALAQEMRALSSLEAEPELDSELDEVLPEAAELVAAVRRELATRAQESAEAELELERAEAQPEDPALAGADVVDETPPAAPAPEPDAAPDLSLALAEGTDTCPGGTRVVGARPPQGYEIWCEREGVRHGPYVAWHPNGELATHGHYERGLESGLWTRYWETGVKRAEAEFREGRQHGRMMLWDRFGYPDRELEWREGDPLSP